MEVRIHHPCEKPARSVQSFRYYIGVRRTYRRTHEHPTTAYRASIASHGKNRRLRMTRDLYQLVCIKS